MVAVCELDYSLLGLRDAALISVMWDCALRSSEASVNLLLSDIDPDYSSRKHKMSKRALHVESDQRVTGYPQKNAFEEYSRENWKASNVAIDIGDHQDGQKIAFQFRRDVGNPLHVATHLASHLNRMYSAHLLWIIQVELIKQNRDFWEAIERHPGGISRAEFEFVTPNLFGSRGELSESMKRLRRRHNAVKVTGVLHNPNGELDLQRDNLEEVVDYISKGGGHAKLKASKTTIYDSDENPKTIRIDDDRSLHHRNVDFWNRLVRRLFGF